MPKLGLAVIPHSDQGFFVSGGERAPVPFLWVHSKANAHGNAQAIIPGKGLHLMFTAESQEAVNLFHQAALEGGGKESDAPGYQGAEVMEYYAALVFDPDGNTLEVGYRKRKR